MPGLKISCMKKILTKGLIYEEIGTCFYPNFSQGKIILKTTYPRVHCEHCQGDLHAPQQVAIGVFNVLL